MSPDGTVRADPGPGELAAAASQDAPFWLDLSEMTAELADWLERGLGLHPLVIEDARQFGERPKLEEFEDYVAVVMYGAGAATSVSQLVLPGRSGAPVTSAPMTSASASAIDVRSLDSLGEVHCIVSARYIVTVHRNTCPALEEAARRASASNALAAGPGSVFYQFADALADSFFPVMDELDDRLDALQAEIIESPHRSQLTELAGYRAMLTPLRKVLLPQADIVDALASGKVRVPGADEDQLPYLRDIRDHLRKLADLADSYRDHIAATADSYSSVVSNQLNVVMKQLAVISTIFLPLSFLTGFFGQNFGALVNHIGSWPAFLGFGVGTEVVAVILLYLMFRRQGWLKS
ncbi:MAG TPA: magnesium transporter CorA family protein [Trebonia sp.]|nr:magnesium transporter CorA family protein [Trebonia sp.]